MTPKDESALRAAYGKMSERVHDLLQSSSGSGVSVKDAIQRARELATELGELSREEADFIADALRRDIDQLSLSLIQAEAELKEWADTDLAVIEQSLLDHLLKASDPTALELMRLREAWEERAAGKGGVHAGQVAEAGAYTCTTCGEIIHLKEAGKLPPCPRCAGSDYLPIRSAVM